MKAKTTILFLILFILINSVFADQLIDQGRQKLNEGNYPDAIKLLTQGCPQNYILEVYNDTVWRCNHDLAYAYEQLASIIPANDSEPIKIKDSLELYLSIYYYETAINISALRKDTVDLGDPLLLANILLAMENYDYADKIITNLENLMKERGYIFNKDTSEGRTYLGIISRLRNVIAKNIYIEVLEGNVYNFEPSYIKINPKITFSSDSILNFDTINLTYLDDYGEHNYSMIREVDNTFEFNKLIILKGYGTFPFDTYVATLKNIVPHRIKTYEVPVQLSNSTSFDSIAKFSKDSVQIIIKRKPTTIVYFYILFVWSLISLYEFNKNIYVKENNNNLWMWALSSIISFVTEFTNVYGWDVVTNIYTTFYILLVLYTLSKLYESKKKIK